MEIKQRKIFYIVFIVFYFFSVFFFAHADNPGVIDTDNSSNQAKVCHDSPCTSFGIINFELEEEESIVIDSDGGISGKVWGNELGWITMNPTGAGVFFADSSTGELTGKAWSQVSGWINFAPTDEGVFIDPDNGEFEGWAWSGGAYGGWIKFDCSDASTCVKTTWRHGSTDGGGCTKNCDDGPSCEYPFTEVGGECICESPLINIGGWCAYDDAFTDVCPNIPYRQIAVPNGMHLENGLCVYDTEPPFNNDVCPNIIGNQSSVPNGMEIIQGQCVDIGNPDFCPNIDGEQSAVPAGIEIVGGQCLYIIDVCPNIPGDQSSVPSGQEIMFGQCVNIIEPDFCPNLTGNQSSVPNGMQIVEGICVTGSTVSSFDACPNMVGIQGIVPLGRHLNDDGECILDIVDIVPVGVFDIIEELNYFLNGATGKLISKLLTLVGLLSGGLALLLGTLLANPFGLADLGLNLLRLWSAFLYGMGFKKRNRPWGVVYDSVTKQPLDPAYVVLNDMNGKEIATSITDIDGRYGFLVDPGIYRIVASKTNYKYPSEKLKGKSSDELYNDLYFGEQIEVKEEGEVLTKNIPLDRIGFDWNEFAKKEQNRMKFYHRWDVLFNKISDVLFMLGFLVSLVVLFVVPGPYNFIIFGLYLILFFLRRMKISRNKKGNVSFASTNMPVSYGILRVKTAGGQEVAHRVLDRLGNYYCLVPKGSYTVLVEKKNDDASYSTVFTSANNEVKSGILKKDFKIQ